MHYPHPSPLRIRLFQLGIALLASGLALLSGCALTISASETLTGDQGAVVVKLITNGHNAWAPVEQLHTLWLHRDTESSARLTQDDFELRRTRDSTTSTAVYSGILPPGRYALMNARGGNGNTTYTFPLKATLGKFDVKAGAVTLVGTLLVQPLEGSRFVIGYIAPDEQLSATFTNLFPALAQQTKDRPINSLLLTPELQPHLDLAKRITTVPSMLNAPQLAGAGYVTTGGRLGRMRWANPGETTWHESRIDSLNEVLTVRAYQGGFLAAGEEGLLRHTRDAGRTWQKLTPPSVGVIAMIEPLPSGKVLAIVRHGNDWTAHLSDNPLSGVWRKIGALDGLPLMGLSVSAPSVVIFGNKVGLALSNGFFHMIDTDLSTIERHTTGHTTSRLWVLPDNTLLMRVSTKGGMMLRSTDDGKTWSESAIDHRITTMTFVGANKAYALVPIGKTYEFATSTDDGKSWKKSGTVPGDLPSQVTALIVDKSDPSIRALLGNGALLRSDDSGNTWSKTLEKAAPTAKDI